MNEAPLTGEADDVAKRTLEEGITEFSTLTPPNMAFAGTAVASGRATAVVVRTGMRTRIGTIARLLKSGDAAAAPAAEASTGEAGPAAAAGSGAEATPSPSSAPKSGDSNRTPLQHKLHRLGLVISIAALLACVTVFVIGALRGYRDPEYPNNPGWLQMVMVAVALAVAAIPEGLPLCVTICLAMVGARGHGRVAGAPR